MASNLIAAPTALIAALLLAATSAACASRPAPSAVQWRSPEQGGAVMPYSAAAGAEARRHVDAAVASDERPMSATVIGLQNPLLARGAEALAAGHTAEGVRLTLEGLKRISPMRDIAAAHANLCAGYVVLRRYDDALVECNSSIALDRTNWRAYNNRAAAFAAQGLYERALEDIATGLKLAPGSPVLQRSLVIIHHNEQVQRRRGVASDA